MKTVKASIYLRPKLSSIPENVKEILEILKQNYRNEDFLFKCELVLTELLSNITEHGFPNVSSQRRNLLISIDAALSKLRIRMEDSCKEWNMIDALKKSESSFEENDCYSERGRGWKIIRSLCSDLSLKRIGENNITEVSISSITL